MVFTKEFACWILQNVLYQAQLATVKTLLIAATPSVA